MAEALGRQLLADIEVVGFAELLQAVQHCETPKKRWLNCAQIDGVLNHISPRTSPPIVEITSIGPGAGKTHLLYLLISLAVLPAQHGGRNGCVIVLDADSTFNVKRLAQQMKLRLKDWTTSLSEQDLSAIILSALHHVYVYKPHSMRSLLDILKSLPERFLHQEHHSIDRCLSFIAIDSASSVYWQTKVATDNATFMSSMSSTATSTQSAAPLTYADMKDAIVGPISRLQCPAIVTSRSSGKSTSQASLSSLTRTLRPALTSPMAQLSTLRLLVRRVPIKRLPSGVNLAELQRENADRSKVVALSRFQCIVDESGLNMSEVKAIRDGGEDNFYFNIKQDGLVMETNVLDEDNQDQVES